MHIYADSCIPDSRAQNVFIHAMRKSLPLPFLFSSLFFIFSLPLSCFFTLPYIASLSLSLFYSLLLSSFSFFSSLFSFFEHSRRHVCLYVCIIFKNTQTATLCLHSRYNHIQFIILLNDAFSVKQAYFRILLYMKITSLLINSEYNNKCTYTLPYLHLLI